MANVYSGAYNQSADGQTYIARAGSATHHNHPVIQNLTASVTTALAAADVIHLCPIPEGARVSKLVITNDDLDTGTPAITFDIGFTSDADAFGNELTVFQGAATTTVSDTTLAGAVAASADDELLVTIVAGAGTEAAGDITVLVEYFIP